MYTPCIRVTKTPLQVSSFALHLSHVGSLERLMLATDSTAWLCELVVVEDKHLKETVFFLCGRSGTASVTLAVKHDFCFDVGSINPVAWTRSGWHVQSY